MRILWLPIARRDLAGQLEYLAERNPWAAHDMDEAIERAVGGLLDQPRSGRLGRLPGTRERVVHGTPFIVVYRLSPGAIIILRLLHGAMKWNAP